MITLFSLFLSVQASCGPGTFYDPLQALCINCDSTCGTCSGIPDDISNNCLSCSSYMQSLISGNCYYPCEISGSCSVCSFQCKVCYDSGCNECFNPYFTSNMTCVSQCPNNTYALNNSCQSCDVSCNECYGPSNSQCLSCSDGYIKVNNSCQLPKCGDGVVSGSEQCDDLIDANCFNCKIVTCAQNQYWNMTLKACELCDAACQGCIAGGSSECLVCSYNFNYVNGSCVQNYCGDGVVAGSEQCETGSDCVNCQIENCHSPVLMNSDYFSDFSGILLEFDGNVTCGSCKVFENFWILGENSYCYCSGSYLYVYFGGSVQFSYESVLVIGKNEINACNERMNITVSGSDLNFKAEILGSQYLIPCSQYLDLNVRVTSTGQTRILSYNWEVFPANQQISSFLSTLTPSIPADIVSNQSLTFLFTCQNFLGDWTSTNFSGQYSIPQDLIIKVENSIEVNQQYENFIRAEIQTCERQSEVFVDWEILSHSTTQLEKFGRIAKIWNSNFDVGDSIDIRITAWVNISRVVEKNLTLVYTTSEIEAVIDRHCVRTKDNLITLNAYKSTYAGLNSSFDYQWTVTSGQSIVATSTSAELSFQQTDQNLYGIELVVNKSGVSDTDQTFVEFSDSDSWVSVESLRIHSDQSLYFWKNNDSDRWSSNLWTDSQNSADFIRFVQMDDTKNPWISTDAQCRVNLKSAVVPVNGDFQVFPASGTAWQTLFELQAGMWQEGYLYQYWFSANNEFVPLTDLIYSSSFFTYLPYSDNLKVKIRVYSIARSYIEQVVQINIQNNIQSFGDIQNFLLGNFQVNDYESRLSAGLVLAMLLVVDQGGNYGGPADYVVGSDSADGTNIDLAVNLLSIASTASFYLPCNEYLDGMILLLVNKVISVMENIIEQNLFVVCSVLQKRFKVYPSDIVQNNTLEIIQTVFEYKSFLSENPFVYQQLESTLLAIGSSIAQKQAFEPISLIKSEDFSIQSVKLPNQTYVSNSSIAVPPFPSSFEITSKSLTALSVLNLFSTDLQLLANASVLIQVPATQNISGLVAMHFLNTSESFSCLNFSITSQATQRNSTVWCHFSSSSRLKLYQTAFEPQEYSSKATIQLNNILFLATLIVLDAIWIFWGFYKDKKDNNTVYTSNLSPDLRTFISSLKALHYFFSIFFTFNILLPRPTRILLLNLRIFTIISSILALSPHMPITSVIFSSIFVSISTSKLLSLLISKKVRKFIKKIPDPPEMRHSPTIKLPDLRYSPTIKKIEAKCSSLKSSTVSETIKYTHVRNFSETNPVQDTNFMYEYRFEYHLVKLAFGISIGSGIAAGTFWMVLVNDMDWWFGFLVSFGGDLLVVQMVSIAVESFCMKKNSIVQSRTLNDSTVSNVVVSG